MSFRSVAEMFLHRVAQTPDQVAFEYPDGSAWATMTWRKAGERVRALASGLRALGLASEERVALLSGTRVEWILADLSVSMASGATSTIYPSNTAEECAYILKDSAATFVYAEDAKQLAKLTSRRDELPLIKKVIVFDGEPSGDWALSLRQLEELGRAYDREHPEAYEQVARAVRPDQLATLIYTSGTTGLPKGVELTHDCWVYEGWAIDEMKLLTKEDKQYLWLPLSHVFGKVLQAAQLQVGFPTAVDGRIDKLVDNLSVVKPTFVAAVPRIFEKVHNKVVMGAKEGGGLKFAIFNWAFGVGRQVSALRQKGQQPSGLLAIQQAIAHRLVFSKLHQRFGGRMRFFISGSAPLARDLAEFFHAAGILVCEGYGLTESSAASFVNRPQRYRFGTVGMPLPGTEVKIAESDGEILLRGRGIMRGYHGKPGETAESLDADGWLHTGDIGNLDGEGFLRITDRKKDLIKTSGGKYVAPQMIEGKLKSICPYISQVVVHGNNRNYCTAIVTLDEESVKKWAADNGLGGQGVDQLAGSDAVRKLIQGYVDELNNGLAKYETVKKFAILKADLSLEAGDLTASLKIKRKVVEQKYRELLDAFYSGTLADMGSSSEGGKGEQTRR